jgi:hypothetical protein
MSELACSPYAGLSVHVVQRFTLDCSRESAPIASRVFSRGPPIPITGTCEGQAISQRAAPNLRIQPELVPKGAGLGKILNNIEPTYELPLAVELRIGRPAEHVLQPLTYLRVFQNVE